MANRVFAYSLSCFLLLSGCSSRNSESVSADSYFPLGIHDHWTFANSMGDSLDFQIVSKDSIEGLQFFTLELKGKNGLKPLGNWSDMGTFSFGARGDSLICRRIEDSSGVLERAKKLYRVSDRGVVPWLRLKAEVGDTLITMGNGWPDSFLLGRYAIILMSKTDTVSWGNKLYSSCLRYRVCELGSSLPVCDQYYARSVGLIKIAIPNAPTASWYNLARLDLAGR